MKMAFGGLRHREGARETAGGQVGHDEVAGLYSLCDGSHRRNWVTFLKDSFLEGCPDCCVRKRLEGRRKGRNREVRRDCSSPEKSGLLDQGWYLRAEERC